MQSDFILLVHLKELEYQDSSNLLYKTFQSFYYLNY